jgi:hypothetical protein
VCGMDSTGSLGRAVVNTVLNILISCEDVSERFLTSALNSEIVIYVYIYIHTHMFITCTLDEMLLVWSCQGG